MKHFLFFLFLCFVNAVFAQKTSIKAIAKDSISGEALGFAASTLLNAKDSQLVQVNYTEDSGEVIISNLKSGIYHLSMSYLSYETQSRKVTILLEDAGKTLDIAVFKMVKKSVVLKDVTIKAEIVAIVLKGDTIEYNAKAFQARPNANVEEILKKMPGLDVDKDGNIKAQGESVAKVLVDGKPFFGDDPKMATKNLPADAIEKVQVYDTKSEQSQFTGINDGSTGKTIDLKLKANRKKGSFGKINAGYGSDERFKSFGTYSRYQPKQKISLIGTANNINDIPFSVQDVYGDLRSGKGNTTINTGSDDISNSLLGGQKKGINTVYSIGTNFSFDIREKTKITGSYHFNETKQQQESSTSTKYFQSEITQNEELTSDDTRKTHRVNLNYEYTFDKRNSFSVFPSFVLQNKNSTSFQTINSYKKDIFLNEQKRNISAFGNTFNLKGNALFKHKFVKEGRTFSLNTNFNVSEGNSEEENTILSKDSIAQKKYLQRWDNQNNTSSAPLSLSYTEPLTKKWKLETSYLYGKWNNTSLRDASILDDGAANFYPAPNVSARLKSFAQQHRTTARLQYEKLLYTLTMEAAYEFYPRKSVSELTQTTINQYFKYFLPSLRFQYNLPKKVKMGLNYNTNINYPSITQLISAPDNSNPLRVQLGNSELLPSYTHSWQTNFHQFDTEKNKFVHAMVRFALPQNAFSSSTVFDGKGRQTSQTVNVNGNYNYSAFLGIGQPIKKVKLNLDASLRGSKRIAFVNQVRSESYSNNIGGNVKLNYNNDNVNIVLTSGLGYNFAKNSLNLQQNNQYYNWDSGAEATFQLPLSIELSSDATFNRYYGLSNGFNQAFTIWNASVAKSFLKDKQLEIKLSAFDILKQNRSINRDVTAQYISDERALNLSQYFLLQATYFLNKAGRPDPKKDGMRMNFGGRERGRN
jgi:hypothetical protein